MNRFWKYFLKYWDEDKGLTSLLVITVLIIFIFLPLQTVGLAGIILLKIFFTLLIIAGIASFLKHKRYVIIAVSIAVLFLFTTWISYFSAHQFIDLLNQVFTILFISLLEYLTLKRVFIDNRITYHRILGAILAFLLIGLIWASMYRLVYIAYPDAFKFVSDVGTSTGSFDLVYFSFVTLCTIGYGDIIPIHPIARSLSILEGVIGVMYPAILIGRLVSQQLANKAMHRNSED